MGLNRLLENYGHSLRPCRFDLFECVLLSKHVAVIDSRYKLVEVKRYYA